MLPQEPEGCLVVSQARPALNVIRRTRRPAIPSQANLSGRTVPLLTWRSWWAILIGGGTVIVDSDTQFVSFVLNADATPGRGGAG